MPGYGFGFSPALSHIGTNSNQNVSALAVSPIDGGFRLTWTGGSGVKDIWGSADNVTFTRVGMVNDGVNTFDDLTPAGLTMYYKVRTIPQAQALSFNTSQPFTLNQVSITAKVDTGNDVVIDYGEDSEEYFTADGHESVKTSALSTSNKTYKAFIFGKLTSLRKIAINNVTVSGINLSQFTATGLTYVDLANLYDCSGSINNLPSTTYYLKLNACAGITGTALPPNVIHAELTTQPLISLDLDATPETTKRLLLNAIGTSTNGNNLPDSIESLKLQAITGLTFSLDNLPNVNLRYLMLANLGAGITGSIDNFNDALIYTHIEFASAASITGSIDNLPNQSKSEGPLLPYILNPYYIKLVNLGNAITGNIANIPSNLRGTLYIIGCGSNITYSGALQNPFNSTHITIQTGLTTSVLDAFLIAWDAVDTNPGSAYTANLAGTNQPRSAASNTAVANLTAANRTLTFTT